jgi:MFS family permease
MSNATSSSERSFLATREGKLTLALLCAVAFLDFVDAPIVNVALPSIRHALHFSVPCLQWVPSAYLLTYGGFMLLGGPLQIFRINGLAYADVTQLVAFAGFLAMFFFLTLYMQEVLHYSPIQTGLAYLPVCFVIGGAAGAASQVLGRVGTRPVIIAGALIAAGGIYWLSRIPVGGSYVSDLLPGMVIMSLGIGPMFVAVTTAANSGVPADKAGLAAALINASQQVGGALGLAIFTALATSHTNHLLAAGEAPVDALNSGLQRGLEASAIFLLASAFVAVRATNTRGERPQAAIDAVPEPAAS